MFSVYVPEAFLTAMVVWERGNKYTGPGKGNNNKIWLIKLKKSRGLQPAAGEFHQMCKGWLKVKQSEHFTEALASGNALSVSVLLSRRTGPFPCKQGIKKLAMQGRTIK